MLYAASTPALCVLEVRVHLDLPFSLLPDDYVLMTIELGSLAVERIGHGLVDTVRTGDRWLAEQRTAVLEVPSVIVPESTNLLLNPAHPAAGSARCVGIRAFSFDRRLWDEG